MREDSEAAATLEAVLRQKAPAIARIIEGASAYRPGWATTAAETFSRHGKFLEAVHQVAGRLVEGLRATTAPNPRWPVAEPRDTGIESNDAKPALE